MGRKTSSWKRHGKKKGIKLVKSQAGQKGGIRSAEKRVIQAQKLKSRDDDIDRFFSRMRMMNLNS